MRIMCKNMTFAMRANKLLYSEGIHSKVEKIKNNPEINGCAYSIVFDDKYFNNAIKVMCEGKIELHKKEKNYFGDGC